MAKKGKTKQRKAEPQVVRVNTFRSTDIKQPSGGRRKMEDVVNLHKFGKEWSVIRLIGGLEEVQQMWISVLPEDGDTVTKWARRVADVDDNIYNNLPNSKEKRIAYFNNAILRDVKGKHKPTKNEVKAGHLIVEENSNSPVVVVRFPPGLARRVKEIAELGKFDVSDPDNGVDLHLRFDAKAPASVMYSLQRGDQTPLTKKERQYLLWPLDQIEPMMSKDEMNEDFNKLLKQCPPDEMPEKKGKGKGKKKKKAPF